VSNTLDDCPSTYAPAPVHCNGCPNPTCDGCFSVDMSFCPVSDERHCFADDAQCTAHQCIDGCVGVTWCSYNEAPFCDVSYATCKCPAASCTYSAVCDQDDDNDGVVDVSDDCPNTPALTAVDSDGCSCVQKGCVAGGSCPGGSTCDDNNDCTSDTCGAASAACLNENVVLGTSCDSGAGQCDGQGKCEAVTWCSATPGCLATQPVGGYLVAGECVAPGDDCYACTAGTTWDGQECVSDACSPPCTPGDTRCDGALVMTCQSNGCWQTERTCAGETPLCSQGSCVCSVSSCPVGQVCDGSVCVAAAECSLAAECDDGDACTVDACTGGTCTYEPVSPVCDATNAACGVPVTPTNGCGVCSGVGSACTAGYCDGSNCVACLVDAHCSADQSCTNNACVCEFDECGGVCVDVLSDEAHCGSCDTVCGVGEFCAAGSCSAVRYAISFPNSLELVAGERARLDVSLVALDGGAVPNVYWEFSSWMGGCAGPTCVKDTTHADIPEQEVTVTALQLDTALVLAEETITFQIACDEDHAVFGPCCHDGSLLRDGQSSCDLDGVTGVCNALGQCV
jgi:hypothetical protein